MLCLRRLPGNGFQRRSFLSFRVQRLLSSLVGVSLTSQLGVTYSQSSKQCYNSHPYGLQTAFPNLSRLLTLATTLHESLSLRDLCSKSRSSLYCWVISFNSGRSFVPGLTSSRAGGSQLLAGWRLSHNSLGVATQRLKTMGTFPPPTPPPRGTISASGYLGLLASELDFHSTPD
jgi:hypothetical protein